MARDHLPDAQSVRYFEVMPRRGRDDFPVGAMWNEVVGGVAFPYPSVESLIRDLGRTLKI